MDAAPLPASRISLSSVQEGHCPKSDRGAPQLQRGQALTQQKKPAARGKHGCQEGQAGQGCQVALGRLVKEDAVTGCTSQQRDVEQERHISPCTLATPSIV